MVKDEMGGSSDPLSYVLCFSLFRQHHHFVMLCLRLLSSHLALTLACGLGSEVLGKQTQPLRNLLFRLVDTSMPDCIQQVSLIVNYHHF